MKLACLLLVCVSMQAAETWTWWAQRCTAAAADETGCLAGDPELAGWALEAWAKQSDGRLKFEKASSESAARLRIEWVGGKGGLYGETRKVMVGGHPVAFVYVLPRADAPSDPLLRDAIVYLTCVHESGHALGLPHTARFEDIMYSFQFGGDIPEYFGRYRRLLEKRPDIREHSGISSHDRAALLEELAARVGKAE